MNPTWVVSSVLNIPALMAAGSLWISHQSRAVWPAVSPVRLVPSISSSQRCGSLRRTVSFAPAVALRRVTARYLSSIPGERSCQPDVVSAFKQDNRPNRTIKQTTLWLASSGPKVTEFRYRIFIIFVTGKSKCCASRFWIVVQKTTANDSSAVRQNMPSIAHVPACRGQEFFWGAIALNWG